MCVKSQWREIQTTDYLVIAIFFPESKKKKKKITRLVIAKGPQGCSLSAWNQCITDC